MDSLDEHLDQQQLQKLLGEVIHNTRGSLDGAVPDHQMLASTFLSRQVELSSSQIVARLTSACFVATDKCHELVRTPFTAVLVVVWSTKLLETCVTQFVGLCLPWP